MAEYHVLNLGAGVQSTCLFLLSRETPSPFRFDAAIFADTGEEPRAVYEHLAWLQSLGQPEIRVRSAGRLGDDVVYGRNGMGKRWASIPAFTAPDHHMRPPGRIREGRVPRQCTREYKIEVVERTIRRELLGLTPRRPVPRGTVVYQYFGITTDEAGRAERARKRFGEIRWAEPVYPFLEMGWSRRDCLRWLEDRVPHPVPRSACVCCPFRTDREWAGMRARDPVGWARAVAIDEALRSDDSVAGRRMANKLYLHRSCVPLPEAAFNLEPAETLHPISTGDCQGMCGV